MNCHMNADIPKNEGIRNEGHGFVKRLLVSFTWCAGRGALGSSGLVDGRETVTSVVAIVILCKLSVFKRLKRSGPSMEDGRSSDVAGALLPGIYILPSDFHMRIEKGIIASGE